MKAFQDNQGRRWEVSIDAGAMARVKAEAGWDLLSVVEDRGALARLTQNPSRLVGTLYLLCMPQADAAGMTPEQFGEALVGGKAFELAGAALLEAIAETIVGKKQRKLFGRNVAALGRSLTRHRSAVQTI